MKFNKNNLPKFEAPIKVGSKVMCVDGSYSLTIMNKSNRLTSTSIGLSNEVFTVVAINVTVPTEVNIYDTSLINGFNNCIIADEEGNIHFVSSINIKNTESLF